MPPELARSLRDHAAKAALSMIDHANHKPENRGHKPKVGGHQASSMSAVDLLSALYLEVLRPGDRVAVKPHAAPVLYAWMHLFGELPRAQLLRLRELGGPQPYPTKRKNPRFVDYTTSSEALGVCATIYDALAARVHDRTADAILDHGDPPNHAPLFRLAARRIHATFAVPHRDRLAATRFLAARLRPIA